MHENVRMCLPHICGISTYFGKNINLKKISKKELFKTGFTPHHTTFSHYFSFPRLFSDMEMNTSIQNGSVKNAEFRQVIEAMGFNESVSRNTVCLLSETVRPTYPLVTRLL